MELAIDDQAVIDRIHKGGGVDIQVDDAVIGRLRKAGASETVLTALQAKDAPADKPGDKLLGSGQLKSGAVLELTSIKRTSDGFLMVNFHYRNPTNKPIKAYHGQIAVFGDTDITGDTFSDVYYVEPKMKIKHMVVQDNAGKLVASKVLARDLLAPANDVGDAFWVKMSSPSDGVDSVTFYFPNVQPIEDVALPPPLKK